MPTVNQDEVVAFLTSEAGFGCGEAPPKLVETHISFVVLSGPHAIKLKRAVRLGYVDFSTPERRLTTCERELELNRRTAPKLYKAVHRITREADGRLALNGGGELVDAVVEMARFDEDGLFENLAARGAIGKPVLTRLAGRIAEFHAAAEADRSGDGSDRIAAVLDINARAFATTGLFPPAQLEALESAFRARLAALSDLLDARARAGKVRRCHGDLHLSNICLIDGEPTLFDCLEFDEAMATTDILYDIAFLLMDLWHRGLRAEANLVLNRYLDADDEEDGLPLISFLMALRAAVRAHVTATQAQAAGPAAADRREEAQAYFELAQDLLRSRPARLIAVGGLSGSGKSTVAAALAAEIGPAPGARILASDRIRKHLFRVSAETRLPADAYRPDISDKVYAELAGRATRIAERGHAVVTDAVFDRPDERTRIANAALSASVPFQGIWLDADADRLLQRVRSRTGDVSDATPDVLAAQLTHSLGAITWTRVRADADTKAVCQSALEAIGASSKVVPEIGGSVIVVRRGAPAEQA
ncbi:bifunctional aminoglycoside phosphotransferase/ATP-binding protein [Bosea thiooxidans]|jgi:aminoglycoside phosphotransferase family enzyme/predicted kinase|uniref:bifunctional aminoglycoside phosphotransferase/ATP-binding protein n=2 Tax=Bosea TaxID=85413 RepID=UPI0009EAB1DF|nr:bifunctional aminoglycoside phosphotransferase/ATP-binding protein [Bosea thiooxidans]